MTDKERHPTLSVREVIVSDGAMIIQPTVLNKHTVYLSATSISKQSSESLTVLGTWNFSHDSAFKKITDIPYHCIYGFGL